jgi:hypothetical protein
MSLISRLTGKPPPATDAPAAGEPEAPEETPRPDPAERAREEEASVSQAIAAGDMVTVGRWVIEGCSTRVRQMAAHAVTDLDQLRELLRATRGGKDKNVHRILAAKRDELLAVMRSEQQIAADLEATAADIAQHSERPYGALYAAALSELEARWSPLEPHATPELRETVARHLARAREVVDRHDRELEAEAERRRAAAVAAEQARREREAETLAAEAAASEAAAEQARAREAERQAAEAKHHADTAAVREMIGLLRQAQSALDHGGTARAARLRDTIGEKLPQAPALPPWFAGQLHALDARIEELKDWNTFRAAPKRAELIERMQSLIGADMSPEQLARQIRHLRDEWRTLNRGATDDATPEWKAFDEVANRAYEPCRVHFAKQAEQRRENQAQREAIIERLTAFAAQQAGEDVDLRSVQQVLTEARNEWQKYAPVEQNVVKSLQARFHAVLDELRGRLDGVYDRNVEAKRAIIARAAGLVTLEDTRRAMDEAKGLQREWKNAGPVPHRQDKALWEEFRRHCDAVFQKSAQQFAAHGAALEAGQSRAVGLCEELERLAGSAGEELEAGAKRLTELRHEFESLELPRGAARDLRRRFFEAGDRAFEAAGRRRADAARRVWTDLFAAGAQVHAYALAAIQGQAPADCEALRDAAASAVAGIAHAPKAARTALEQQLAMIAEGKVSADFDANESALRMLCIRAELAVGRPTPAEDAERRREYQIQRLAASMGGGERPTPTDLDALALEWFAAGPVEAATYDALHTRFLRCRGPG